jgi:hypothetical protein
MGEYMGSGIGLGDAMILANRNGGNGQWDNPFMYLVWLAVLGNGGLGGFGGGNGALTRADLTMGFNDQDTRAGIRGIQQGLCDGFYATRQGISELGFAMKDCCCGINRNIDAARYDAGKNTYDITNAIHAEGEATRALINQNTIQELRDKLEARDREVMTRDFQLSQLAQNQYLVNEIRPCAKPAYITCSPYTTASFCGAGV